MQGEFSLKLDKIHRFIASGYGLNSKKELSLTRQLPCWSFLSSTKTMLTSYNSVSCKNQLPSTTAAATAVALRADGVCGLMLAKLRILHMRAGTLLQAAL